ncbi:MAG: ATP-binding protein [Phocaeicola sp.]
MAKIRLIHLLRLLIPLVAFLLFPALVKANETAHQGTLLVISSYNPEAQTLSTNIADFVDEFARLGGKSSVVVESMNCMNLSEALTWNDRLLRILNKYSEKNRPELILLLGQEAWATYLSLDIPEAKTIPIMCGMVSSNVITIPKEPIDLVTWEPVSKSVQHDFRDFNIVGGYLYEYNIEQNVELISSLFPDTKRIAFLSDNTYGGVNIQMLAKAKMKNYPHIQAEWIDGRVSSLLDVNEKIAYMGDSTAVLVGTWRIDNTEKYAVGRSNYMLYDLNPLLPVFTATTIGLGSWAVGGYTPKYQMVGRELAQLAYNYLSSSSPVRSALRTISSNYIFDAKRLFDFGILQEQLPAGAELVNLPPSLFDEYRNYFFVAFALFLLLLICFCISLFYVVRINRLKHHLEQSSAELVQAKEEAEEANRLKTAFLANMSHEIRTPLNAIVGFSNVLIGKEATDQEREEYCEIIQTNSDLLLHLINDILDISRLESGHIQMLNQQCNLGELCKMALSTVEYTRRTAAHFCLNMADEPIYFVTDSQRFQQVLINLLSNAAKFTSQGSITVEGAIDASREKIIIKVIDTGCGVPVEKSERIFERFEKLNEYAQGTGLGLSICKVIVEQLGGEIWLDKSYVDGACFVFTHPLSTPTV